MFDRDKAYDSYNRLTTEALAIYLRGQVTYMTTEEIKQKEEATIARNPLPKYSFKSWPDMRYWYGHMFDGSTLMMEVLHGIGGFITAADKNLNAYGANFRDARDPSWRVLWMNSTQLEEDSPMFYHILHHEMAHYHCGMDPMGERHVGASADEAHAEIIAMILSDQIGVDAMEVSSNYLATFVFNQKFDREELIDMAHDLYANLYS